MKFERPIMFIPGLARELGGIEEAIFYQQLHYWMDKGTREDGFIYKSTAEIEEETTLTRFQQDRIRAKLVKKGWIEIKKTRAPNGSPTLHYRCIIEISICKKLTNRNAGNLQMDMQETDQCSITESTTESTADTMSGKPDDGFEEFWAAYPKKELKKKTEEIWKRKKLGRGITAILNFIARAKQTDRWKKGFVKQPPAFLNGECYNDNLEGYMDRQQENVGMAINSYK